MGEIQDILKEIKYAKIETLNQMTNANNVTYSGDLETYFKAVDSCEIKSRILTVLSDMYKEIKKIN